MRSSRVYLRWGGVLLVALIAIVDTRPALSVPPGQAKRTTTTTTPSSTTTTTLSPTSTTSTTVAPTTTTTPPISTSPRLYQGGWIKEDSSSGYIEAPWNMTAASSFEQHTGKAVSMIQWSSPFYNASYCGSTGYCSFQTAQFDTVRNHGSIPFFSWNSGPGTGAFTNAQIAAGSQDTYITNWATAAKNWGHPFFLRFDWEMNGSWFPWGVGANGTTAADHVAMWRHVHDIFTRVGATNATWVWCPNIDTYNTMANLSTLYPGDAYVDWTCLDGYNGNNPWTSFSALYGSTYDKIVAIAPTKPMVIGEVGSTEVGGSKAQWIADMGAALPTRFPQIKAVNWFNKREVGPGGYTDWPIESSATAQAAYAKLVQSSSFAGNSFGSISVSPIPPL